MPSCFCDLQMKYNQQVPSGGLYLSLTVTNRFGLSSSSVVTNRFLKIFETTEVLESNAEFFCSQEESICLSLLKVAYICSF